MNYSDHSVRSPWVSLFSLLGLTMLCAVGIQLLVLLIQVLLHLGSETSLSDLIQVDFENNLVFSYTMIIASSFGTFLLPTLILQRRDYTESYYPNKRTSFLIFIVVAAFMFAFAPLMQLIAEWNMSMRLPSSLHGLEEWMRIKEDEMAELTKSIVMVDDWRLLALNLLAVAVMPAIAEEFYFRGALMNILGRLLKNNHFSIWLTAIIFSAIHVQFFGFLPRVLLGAFFGYMLLWTQNVWVPVLGHFINNGTAVVVAFNYTRSGKSFEEVQSSEVYSTYIYVASFIFSVLLGWYFYSKTKQINYLHGKRLGKN